MPDPVGAVIRARRELKAWTIEDLAAASDMAPRQIQRIETGESTPKPETLAKIGAALNTDAAELLTGLSLTRLDQLVDDNTCPFCRAPLADGNCIPSEHGEIDYDRFECGATRGWRNRPCAADPAFPPLAQYNFVFLEETDGMWSCLAEGVTEGANAVELRNGHTRTRELAEKWVLRSFVEARDGHDAAESQYPSHSLL